MAQKKKARIKARRLGFADRIIASALTATTILSPLPAGAALTAHDGYGTTVVQSGTKWKVSTSKKNGDKAFNRFSKFELAQGHVANMILPKGTNKLYNFVNSKIDVQGTVNAIKELENQAAKIGGHLIFISPEGMIIGKKGAINAGKFSAIIADTKTYNNIAGSNAPWDHSEFKRMEAGYVALNPEGSIVVQGNITAPGGITLKARQIRTEAGSRLDTKKTQLSLEDVVNIEDLGLAVDQSLTLERDGDGTVRLEALGAKGVSADIEHAGAIDAAGSVVMRARAAGSSYSAENESKGTFPYSSGDVNFKARAQAKVTVKNGGTVSADKDVVLSADVWNFREDTTLGEGFVNVAKELGNDFSFLKFDASFTHLDATAAVTVESGAKLEALGSMKLQAESIVGAKVGTSLGFRELIKYANSDTIPAAAAVVSIENGSATVVVDGELSSGGNMDISAASKLKADLTAAASVSNFDSAVPFTAAVLWADLANNAAVTIGTGAKIEAKGSLSVASDAQNSIKTAAVGSVPANAPGSTALNATFAQTSAQTQISADLSAGGALSVTANDTTSEWNSSSENRSGTALYLKERLKSNLTKPALTALYNRVADGIGLPDDMRYGNGAGENNYGSEWGFSVLYTGENFFRGSKPTMNASVSIADGVKLVSPKDVAVRSRSLLDDWQFKATSAVGGSDRTSADIINAYSFALLWGNPSIESSALIGKNASVLAGGSIDVESGAIVEYTRVAKAIAKFKEDLKALRDGFTFSQTQQTALDALLQQRLSRLHSTVAADALNENSAFHKEAKGIGDIILSILSDIKDGIAGGVAAAMDLMALSDYFTYANVYASSSAITANEHDENVSGGGSFALTNWRSNSRIDIASGAHLNAGAQTVVLGTSQNDAAVIGGWHVSPLFGVFKDTKGSAAGGTILINVFNSNNDVDVHKEANLESAGKIALGTKNGSALFTGSLSAANGKSWGFQGLLNITGGALSRRVRIDDEVMISSPLVSIISNAENYATNMTLTYSGAQGKSVGAGIAVDLLTYETVAKIADHDTAFSDDQTPASGAFIAANSLDIGAFSHSRVNTIAVAGAKASAVQPEDPPAEEEGNGGLLAKLRKLASLPDELSKKAGQSIANKISGAGGLNDSINQGMRPSNNGAVRNAGNSILNGRDFDLEIFGAEALAPDFNFNFAGAGSAAWNFVDYISDAGIEGTAKSKISLKPFTDNSNRVIAIDALADKWQSAYSGGASIAGGGADEVTTVGIGGAVSVNSGKSVVSAGMKNAVLSALDNSRKDVLSISSGSSGRAVAAALGLTVTRGSGESGYGIAVNLSANTLDNTVTSRLTGVDSVTSGVSRPSALDLDVLSYAKDTQVTGAVDVAIGKARGNVGASIQFARIKNDISSVIDDTRLLHLREANVDSYLGVTQVVAGITTAVGLGGDPSSWSGSGALVIDTLANSAAARITSSDLKASGTLSAEAGDGADIDSRVKQHKAGASFDLQIKSDDEAYNKLISAESYYSGVEIESAFVKKTTSTLTGGKASASSATTVDSQLSDRTGMIVITGAVVGGAAGKSAGSAIVVDSVNTTFETRIENSSVTARSFKVNSENSAALVSVAAGAAAGTQGWSGYGSVIWNTVVNTASTVVKNADITVTGTDASSLAAQNRALSVGVAGAVSVALNGLSAGFTLGYSHVTNNAVVSVSGGAKKTLAGAAGSLSANALNKANSWLVGSATQFAAGSGAGGGSGVFHRVTGSTSSVIDGSTVTGFKDLDVTAAEMSSGKTISTAVSASGTNAAVGGAITISQIGVINSKDQEYIRNASVRNSTVKMADQKGRLNIAANDDAALFSLAIGGGYASALNINGAITVNQLHRRGIAAIENTNVTGKKTAVSVKGTKDSRLSNIGVEVSASSAFGGGGSLVINRIGDENLVRVTGTKSNVIDSGSFYSFAKSDTTLTNAAVGFSAGAEGAGQGMVLVNSVSPTTGIVIKGLSVKAVDTLAAITMSDAQIRNYAGQGAGGAAGGGTGLIEVNYLNDTVSSLVQNSTLTANGSGSVAVSHDINDNEIDNTNISKYSDYETNLSKDNVPGSSTIYDNAFQGTFDTSPLRSARRGSTARGLVIDASSTHSLLNTAAVGAGGTGGGVAGSVNVDILAGSTKAQAIDGSLNSASDINVHASDFSNVSGVFIAGGGGAAGFGLMTNVRHVRRDVDASIKSTSADVKYDLNANGTASAGAVSKQSLTGFMIAGGGGEGTGGGIVAVEVQKGTTTAVIDGMKGHVGGLQTASDHFSRVGDIMIAGAGGMGAGGLVVSVATDNSLTAAQVRDSDLDVTGAGSVVIDGRNRNKGYVVNITAAGGMGSGAVGVNVTRGAAVVDASLLNTRLGAASQRAGDVKIRAHNTADILTITGGASGGMGAGSILVNVNNLYSHVGVNVSNSKVYANTIGISADEDYKLRAHTWGASGGLGAGIIFVQSLNIGGTKEYDDPGYSAKLTGYLSDQSAALAKAQLFVNGQSGDVDTTVLTAKEAAALKNARSNDISLKRIESSDLSVHIGQASVLDAARDITVRAVESTDIGGWEGGATGGLGSGAVNVATMSANKNVGIGIDQSKMDAGRGLRITSELAGTNTQKLMQGLLSLGHGFAAYSGLSAEGASRVSVAESQLRGLSLLEIRADDSSQNIVYGRGYEVSLGAVGGIVSRGRTSNDISVSVYGGSLRSDSTVSLVARRYGRTEANIFHFGVNAGDCVGADSAAHDSSAASVTIGSAKKTEISAAKIAVASRLDPDVISDADQANANVFLSVGVSLSEAKLTGSSSVTLGAKNIYSAPEVEILSYVGHEQRGLGVSALNMTLGGTVIGIDYQYSRADAINDSTAGIVMNGGTFGRDTRLKLHAWNTAAMSADIATYRVGLATIGSSNNAAKVVNNGRAAVTITNSSTQTLAALDAKAQTTVSSNARADSGGGGAIYLDKVGGTSTGSAKAAWSRTEINDTAELNISGMWKTTGEMKLKAEQSSKTTDWADGVIGGIVTGTGTQHDLYLTGKARVSVAGNSVLTSDGTLQIDAVNRLADNPNNQYTASGNTYGGVAGNGTNNYAVVNQQSSVIVQDKAKLFSVGAMTLTSHAESDMKEYARVVSGGVGAGSGARNDFRASWHNGISIGSGATLTTSGSEADLTLAAWDREDLELTALGNVQLGLAGGATSKLFIAIDRVNAVTVAGTLNADRDVSLNAGADSSGTAAALNMTDISHAYAHSIGAAGAWLERAISQDNSVTVKGSGSVRARRDANLYALPGTTTIIESVQRYAWTQNSVTAGSVVSTALGDAVKGLYAKNSVAVDGHVNAGFDNKFEMNIGEGFAMLQKGADGEYSLMDWENGTLYLKKNGSAYVQGTAADHDAVMTSAGAKTPVVSITSGKTVYRYGLTESYDTYLYDRLAVLDKLTADYDGDRSSAAWLAYDAERTQIIATLSSYGLPLTRPDEDSRSVTLMVPWIEIGPVSVAGGNINIKADTFSGAASGTLDAGGAPLILIVNDSSLALKLNGLTVQSGGGEVFVNAASVKNADELRRRVKAASGFAGTINSDPDGRSSKVSVSNTFPTSQISVTITDSVNGAVTTEYAIVSDIENTGGISNLSGTVELATQIGSIRSVGSDIIAGKGLTLSAPQGSISISSEGIMNIDGAPESTYWAGVEKLSQNMAGGSRNHLMADSLGVSSEGDQMPEFYRFYELANLNETGTGKGHLVAGGNIFITAGVINVNGTIQSGFGTYDLKLDQSCVDGMNSAYVTWAGRGYPNLENTPAALKTYQLTRSGAEYDSARGEYVYHPATWYNPSTETIVVEDIVGSGGTVYLTGKIINTNYWDSLGDEKIREIDERYAGKTLTIDGREVTLPSLAQHRGRILAYTGAASVNIESSRPETLQLGRITLDDRTGRIVLVDKSYDDPRVTVYEQSGTSSVYTPREGIRYNISTGTKSTNTVREIQQQSFSWWGDSWDDKGKTISREQSESDHGATLSTGASVTLLADIVQQFMDATGGAYSSYKNAKDSFLVNMFSNATTSTGTPSEWVYSTTYDDFLHKSGTITRTRIRTDGSQSTAVFSLKADNPISVGFRSNDGPGRITISAENADVALTGSVSTNAAASVSITAKNILTNGKAQINADTVNLTASGAVGAVKKGNSYSPQKLSLRPRGDTLAVTATAVGSIMALNAVDGTVNADLKVSGTGGRIMLDAENSINGTLQAAAIEIASQHGDIGGSEAAPSLTIAGEGRTVLSAAAGGAINIVKQKGDLAIDHADAKGNVRLETQEGSIVDANPVSRDGSISDEKLIELWKNAALIDKTTGGQITNESRNERLAELENRIRAEDSEYQRIALTLASSDVLALDNGQKELLGAQLEALDEYAGVTNVEDYIRQLKTTAGTELYELANIDGTAVGGWTQDYLLYAVQDAVLNPGPGTVQADVQSIISGTDVTLISSAHIGSEEAEQRLDGGVNMTMDGLKKLSAASPADVTWDNSSGQFVIRNSYEIGLTADKTTAKASGMILLASPNQTLFIDSVESTGGGKIHLMADGSVLVHESSQASTAVKGGSMFLAAAGSMTDIGSADRPLTVEQKANSVLRASAGRDVYLVANSGSLSLGSIAAAQVLSVETKQQGAGILMGDETARLNAKDVRLVLNGGDVGTSDTSVNVQTAASNDFSSKVTIRGAKNVYLYGDNGLNKDGWLNVDGLKAEDADVQSQGGLALSGDVTLGSSGLFCAENDLLTSGTVRGNSVTFISGGNTDLLGNISGGAATITAGRDASIARATVNALSVNASDDISVGRIKAKSTNLTSGASVTAAGLIDSDVLTVDAGTDATFVDVKSKTLQIDAGGVLTTRTVRGYTSRLTAKGGLKANGDYDSDTLTIESGASAYLASLSAQRLTVAASEDLSMMNVNADVVKLTSGGDVTVKGKIYGGQTNLEASGDVIVTGDTDANTLTVRAGADAQLAGVKAKTTTLIASGDISVANVKTGSGLVRTSSGGSTKINAAGNLTLQAKSGGDLNVSAAKKLTMRGDASSGGDMYLTAHEISARNLTSEKNLTALSETTFTANDLKAGGDLRVHTYGDMTFNDATAGGSAWILGLGSSAARLKFHEVRTGGHDTAILLERGYLDYWQVTAGLDVAVGVRHYEDPNSLGTIGLVDTLAPDSAYYIFYPYGGSLMPEDPFNFHVVDLLHDSATGRKDIAPIAEDGDEEDSPGDGYLASFGREARRMWPRKKPLDTNLLAGSDDIEVNLDDYGYWLPEEAEHEHKDQPLSLSRK